MEAGVWCVTLDSKLPRYERIERHKLREMTGWSLEIASRETPMPGKMVIRIASWEMLLW